MIFSNDGENCTQTLMSDCQKEISKNVPFNQALSNYDNCHGQIMSAESTLSKRSQRALQPALSYWQKQFDGAPDLHSAENPEGLIR